jgi:SAM-dependent methyltransferase
MNGKWPKVPIPLTKEQKCIREDFVKYWHEVLPSKYNAIEEFNHGYPAKRATRGLTLEIGAGIGEHLEFEDLRNQTYFALELRNEMADVIRERFPNVTVITGDCQQRMPFDDGSLDRVIAIHVLEHLPNLPVAVAEVRRILKDTGTFQICIPCEGGIAYGFARKISAERLFKKRYKMKYDWFVKSEHVNLPSEILFELDQYFTIVGKQYFPCHIPSTNLNLVIGLELRPRPNR